MTEYRQLELGNGYYLCSDAYSWWIMKDYVYKSGKNKGKQYQKNITGYHPTAESAFLRLSEAHTRLFDTTSIKTLIKETKKLKKAITEMIKGYENGRL